jgi:2'-5' RNA ligase
MKMRCFVAVDLDSRLEEAVESLQKKITGDVKLVEKNNLHFTLKFLGDIDEKTAEKAKSTLDRIADSTKPFSITISGIGAFPNEKFVRVIWIGADNNDRDFLSLHRTVDDELADIAKKEKPVPHLTLARVREQSASIQDFISNNRNAEIGSMIVDRIKLKKSTLSRSGPVYEDVAVFGLKK